MMSKWNVLLAPLPAGMQSLLECGVSARTSTVQFDDLQRKDQKLVVLVGE